MPPQVLEEMLEAYRNSPKAVRVAPFLDHFPTLAGHIQSAVSWSHKSVYSVSSAVYGVKIIQNLPKNTDNRKIYL